MGLAAPSPPVRSARDLILPAVERMVARAGIVGDDARRFWRIFDLLTRESLDHVRSESGRRFSGICRDGTPWQFCAVMGSHSVPVRFLTEAGSPSSPLRERTALTLSRLTDVFDLIGAPGGRKTADVLAGLCPQDDDHLAGLWVGLATGATIGPRVRIYANNGWGDMTERWLRLIRALRELHAGRFAASLQPLLPLILPVFSPAGFAVTVPATSLLCKLYLRPIASPWSAIRALARSLLAARAGVFIAGIEDALGQPLETLPERAAVVSMAGPAAEGPLDLKLDLCGHCLFDDDTRAVRVIERLGYAFGLDPSPYRAMLEDLGETATRVPKEMVAFVGIGGNATGADRLNVYLTPPAPEQQPARRAVPSPRRACGVPDALQRGITAILDRQQVDGSWRDFCLPVGIATTWPTAYTLLALQELSRDLARHEPVRAARARAAAYLEDRFRPGAGWGYNESVEPDADSTALATLALRREGVEPVDARAALFRFRHDQGGFGTFRRDDEGDAWGHCHADVNPTVIRTLGASTPLPAVEAMLRAREPSGIWRSYWWADDLYAIAANLRALRERCLSHLMAPTSQWLCMLDSRGGPFHAALLVGALLDVSPDPVAGDRLAELVPLLLESQRPDGLWQGTAALRLTDAAVAQPWHDRLSAGRLYLDGGVFTTATVVGSLARWLASGPASAEPSWCDS